MADNMEIKTAADLMQQLNEMKSSLEASMEQKADAKIAEKLEAITAKIDEIKALKPEVTVDELKSVKDDLSATMRAIDLLSVRVKQSANTPAPKEAKSFESVIGETLTEKTDDINKFLRKEQKNLIVELKAVGDMTTSNVTGSRYGQIFQPGIMEAPKRKIHIRQLIPGGVAGAGNSYTFMREAGGEGNIAATAETATKPQLDFDLVESTVNFETIAGWVRISRKALNNIPGMVSFLQSRLPEKLLRVEDEQLLNGDGVSPNIKGIIQTGNYTAATSTSLTLIEQLMDSIAQLEDLDREATGILVTPSVWMSLFKNKSTGSGEFDLPYNITWMNNVLMVSGVPVFASTAISSGKYIVGDWAMGAQLLTQEGVRIEFFDQDGTNVRENKITVRIEESVAFPVYGSDHFIVGDVPAI